MQTSDGGNLGPKQVDLEINCRPDTNDCQSAKKHVDQVSEKADEIIYLESETTDLDSKSQ
eukprot:3215917-Amphidinium_carterae.1